MKNHSNFHVGSYSVAHMIAQVRARQLAIEHSQDNLQTKIALAMEDELDFSGNGLTRKIQLDLSYNLHTMTFYNSLISKAGIKDLGYPIKCNKTALQLKMALDWAVLCGSKLITKLESNLFYHNLTNDSATELPVLQSPSDTEYWGNENPSVSTVLLYSVASTLQISLAKEDLIGAGTFYPYYNSAYSLNDLLTKDMVIEGSDLTCNPFILNKGLLLIGDYQFGGHRYMGQLLFGPEDCSSAVGKATCLNPIQILQFNTSAIKAAYIASKSSSDNEYGYQAITSSENGLIEFDKIQPGDIYQCGGHTAIICEKNNNIIKTLEFNREIDIAENKRLGGGIYTYDLSAPNKNPIYILRKNDMFLGESYSSEDVISMVDENFLHYIVADNSTNKRILGDSGSYFLKSIQQEESSDCKNLDLLGNNCAHENDFIE